MIQRDRRIHHMTLKAHFETKGLYVGLVADKWGKVHTLSLYHVPPGHPDFMKRSHLFSLRVSSHDGCVDPEHLREQVRRHAAGLPSVHPHTGELDWKFNP